MRPYALALSLAFVFTASASADTPKKIDLRPQQDAKKAAQEDPGSAANLLYKTTGPEPQKKRDSSLTVTATCTDPMGMVLKSTDKGYEACVRNLDRLKPKQASEKNPNSVGITIGR